MHRGRGLAGHRRAPCTLQGWPGVSFVAEGDGTQLGAGTADPDRAGERPTITPDPGASARAPLSIARAASLPGTSATRRRRTASGSTRRARPIPWTSRSRGTRRARTTT
ncbi:DUF4232 domain-containing protein [uncultured Cellulomonas sp.]|uniref:DUF4232 domain-containing protein n=1 Tax=uncultured Cellulomonas sp. TaxID=189682 RepID=UPI00345BEA3B